MADENNIEVNIGANPAGVQAGTRKASEAIGGVSQSARDLDRAFRQIKSAIDPTFAAQEKYNKSISDANALLQAGRLSQEEYGQAVTLAKQSLERQIESIKKNSAAALAAAAENKRVIADEASARAQAAQQHAQELARAAAEQKALTGKVRAEIDARRAAERAAIREAVAEARNAAAQRVAAENARNIKAGGTGGTKAEGLAEIRAAAAAAKLAAQEKVEAEKIADQQVLASHRAAYAEAKALATDAAATASRLAHERSTAETAASQATVAANKRARSEEAQAARDATAAAIRAARERARAESEAAKSTREAAQQAQRLAREEREAAEAVRELRGAIDPTYAAQERYNQTMQRATQLLMQNKLQQGEWNTIQKQARAQMDLNVRSMGRMNSMNVQMGYQMQDVVASWSSGISPLVILAQQGGQTAAALSQMGGKVGQVAAFFAGPWGAAIIGATLLLGMFIDQNKKAKDSTVDLMDAESRRKAKLDALVDSIKEYTKAQRDANETSGEATRRSAQAVYDLQSDISARKAWIEQQTKSVELLKKNALASGNIGGALILEQRLVFLRNELKKVEAAALDAQAALREVQFKTAADKAEVGSDEKKALTLKFDNEVAALRVKQLAGAIKQEELEKGLLDIAIRRKAAEDALTESKKRTRQVTEETARYIMPVEGPITSPFGKREPFKTDNGKMASTFHGAVDIGAPRGATVKAPQVGVIEEARYSPTLGKYIVINHGANVKTRFGHLDEISVQPGDRVTQGQQLGKVGSTGNATGPHLHYQVLVNGKPVDPTKGIFPVDKLEAEQKVAENVFERIVASYDREIAAQEDNYQEALNIQDRKIAAIQAYYGDESEQAIDAATQRLAIEKKLNAQLLDEQRRGIQARAQVALSEEDVRSSGAEVSTGMKEDVSDFKADLGIITERQAAIEKKALLQEEYQNQVAHEQRMFQIKAQAVRDQLALSNLPVAQKVQLNAQLEALEAEHNARMTTMQQQHAREAAAAQMRVATATQTKWREVAGTLTSSMQSAFQGMWTYAFGWKQALINIADQLVYKFVDMGTQMLEDWIMKQVTKKAVTTATTAAETAAVAAGATAQTAAVAAGATAQTGAVVAGQVASTGAVVAGQTAQVAATAAGATASTGISLGAALAQIGAHAATAAAGAYAALAGIPVIGPFIAPAAAALALGAVLAFGASIVSARGGQGQVKKDGQITELHKDEMVLPAWIANPMRQSLQTRGSSRGLFSGAAAAGGNTRNETNNRGGDVNFKYAPQTNVQEMSMDRMLQKDGATMRKWIRNQVRNGNLRFA